MPWAGGRVGSWLRWLGLLLLPALAAAVRGAGIEMVLSEETGAYVEVADALAAELGRHEPTRLVAAALERDGVAGRNPDVVVALGTRAVAAALAAHTAPVVAAMVPAEPFEALVRSVKRPQNARPPTAVFLDQPVRRQINLIRLAFPDRRRVGVLLGSERDRDLRPLRDAASDAGIRLMSEQVGTAGVYVALSRLLAETEVLLALPDSAIFNATNIHNILLATYRAHVPVIGFSPAYVRAGAVLALYSTPRQIAAQLAAMVQQATAVRGLPSPQYPIAFTVGVNDTVARALGIDLEDLASLGKRLASLEGP